MKVVLDPGAYMPTRAHKDDAGLDLYAPAAESCSIKWHIPPYRSIDIDTGVHVAIPKNCVGFIKSKSGLMVKQDITTDGTIDAGYTGSICVKLFNHGLENIDVYSGQKIAQLVILPIKRPKLRKVFSLKKTERGAGGFGSTGKF